MEDALRDVCEKALATSARSDDGVKAFLEANFSPFEVVPLEARDPEKAAFFTAYYEPVVEGSLAPSVGFQEPLLARPVDLIDFDSSSVTQPNLKGFSAARRSDTGELTPYSDRRAIENGALGDRSKPLLWVRDAVEAFMIQVQGSAVIKLQSGELVRVSYAGRNGHPYTSVGKRLVQTGEIPLEKITLALLKQWVRDHGQGAGDSGRKLLQENASFVFFSIDMGADRQVGPIGAAGAPLTPERSIAIDKNVWSYGLPFWVDLAVATDEPTAAEQPFRTLVIAQDTGGAIIGPARVDLYLGSGEAAGTRAGNVRNSGRLFVFLPKSLKPNPRTPEAAAESARQ